MKAWLKRRVMAMVEGFYFAVLCATIYELIRYPNGRPAKPPRIRHECAPPFDPWEVRSTLREPEVIVRVSRDGASFAWTMDRREGLTAAELRSIAGYLSDARQSLIKAAATRG